METLITLASLVLSVSVFASDIQCSNGSIEMLEQQILNADSCQEAYAIAEACAYGTSVDVPLVKAAVQVCYKELNGGREALATDDASLLQKMEARCDKSYAGKAGTMYASMNAFCKLDAAKFIVNANFNEEY